jgi:hypothetical protein
MKSDKPDLLVFTEIVFTKSIYMRYVSPVNPAWLADTQT